MLETILKHKSGTYLTGVAAGALYHHTGNIYEATTQDDSTLKFNPSDINLAARQVILQSKGRKRTFNEMLVLDSSFRPFEDARGIEQYFK